MPSLKIKILLMGILCGTMIFFVSGIVYGDDGVEQKAQLEINKTALLENNNEKTRVNAAVLLLLSRNNQAREILLGALKDANNTAAKVAVCKALKQSRTWDESVPKKRDFVEPLISILAGGKNQQGNLAAEALVTFDYNIVADKLVEIIESDKTTKHAKMNALYALRLRPEKEAVLKLIEFAEKGDADVSGAAAKSLEKLVGVPAGADKAEWKRIYAELKNKSRSEFVSDRLVMQYDKVRSLEEELEEWKSLYFSSLNKFYDQLADDSVRKNFLVSQLGDSKEEIILWGLEKVSQWIKSGKPVPDEVGKLLLEHIDNGSRDIRIETAKLLSGLGYIGPGKQLLAQFKVEKNTTVKLEQFKALGEVIYYGLSPGAEVEVANSIRLETLEAATEYLKSDNDAVSVVAAKVIGKLLEQNGLAKEVASKYFTVLLEQYNKIPPQKTETRGEFVSVMSRLCQPSSTYRVEAAMSFKKVFEEGLSSDGVLVRQSSMEGLENIDMAAAVKAFREAELYNDQVESVRFAVYDVAGQVGGEEDLDWLISKLGSNGDSEPAWRSFNSIIARLGVEAVLKWAEKVKKAGLKGENYFKLLTIVEKKAAADKNQKLPVWLKVDLAGIYNNKDEFDNALNLYGDLLKDAAAGEEVVDRARGEMIDIYLKKGDFGKVGQQLALILAVRDMRVDEDAAKKISGYLGNKGVPGDKKVTFVAVLSSIEAGERPNWNKLLDKWRKTAGIVQEKTANNNNKTSG